MVHGDLGVEGFAGLEDSGVSESGGLGVEVRVLGFRSSILRDLVFSYPACGFGFSGFGRNSLPIQIQARSSLLNDCTTMFAEFGCCGPVWAL